MEPVIIERGSVVKITYNDTTKDLPVDQLYYLFSAAGWTGSESTPDPNVLMNFNVPFINSTLVISAWDHNRLVGTVRVLSDRIVRSVIYDLVVDPKYRGMGIGRELVNRCIAHFPSSEWLVQTEKHIAGYYEKLGFKIYSDVVLSIPFKYSRKGENNG